MSLAVMGSGSRLKRSWDDTDHERLQHRRIGLSTTAAGSSRRFSVDLASSIDRRLPPIYTQEHRSQVLRDDPWTRNADAEELTSFPRPPMEDFAKRPRLSYAQTESASVERSDFKSPTANSSVRTPTSALSRQTCSHPLVNVY